MAPRSGPGDVEGKKRFPRIPLPNAMRCLLLKFDRAPTSARRRCMVQVFSRQAEGFHSAMFFDSGGNGHGWTMVAVWKQIISAFTIKELWFFTESSLLLFCLYCPKDVFEFEVWVWCGAHSSVASCHSWRRYGALITLPNTNPSWPIGLLTITAVLTLNQTLQLSHSSRLIICSLGSCRHTSVSQVPNWMMWGFVVCREAGCCCNNVYFQQDKKG